MRVVCYADILSTTKGWPKAGVAVDCILVRWVARVLGGRDVVRVGEGEDEAFCMILVALGGAVPWKNAVSTKEMAIAGSDDGEGGSFVVAVLVEVGCCKSLSAILLVLVLFLTYILIVFLFVWRQYIHSCLVDELNLLIGKPLLQRASILVVINEHIAIIEKDE